MPAYVVVIQSRNGFTEPLASFRTLDEARKFADGIKTQLKEPGSKILIYEVEEPYIAIPEMVAALTRIGRPRAISCSAACRQRGFDDGIEYGMIKEYAFTRNWGVWEVFREFVQNALDEMHDLTGVRPLVYPCKFDGFRTIIEDSGRGIAVHHLLLGTSEKKSWQRGRFGEGMKIALLVAAAQRIRTRIMSGDKVFEPMFVTKSFGERDLDIFCVCVKRSGETIAGTRIVLETPARNYCNEFRTRFIQGIYGPECIALTVEGYDYWYDIVYPKCTEGKPWVFLRDIAISSFEYASMRTACFTYNLFDIELDESRRVPSYATVESDIRRLWNEVVRIAMDEKRPESGKARKVLSELLRCLVERECADVEGTKPVAAEADMNVFGYLTMAQEELIRKIFRELYGEDTIVVSSPDLVKLADYFGIPHIVCTTRRVGSVLESITEGRTKIIDFMKKKVRDVVPKEMMPPSMRRKLELLEAIAKQVFRMDEEELKHIAYTVMDENVAGLTEIGELKLIRLNYNRLLYMCENLQSLNLCLTEYLGTLGHELTHYRTGRLDLTKEFQDALTDLMGSALHNSIILNDEIKKYVTELRELFSR